MYTKRDIYKSSLWDKRGAGGVKGEMVGLIDIFWLPYLFLMIIEHQDATNRENSKYDGNNNIGRRHARDNFFLAKISEVINEKIRRKHLSDLNLYVVLVVNRFLGSYVCSRWVQRLRGWDWDWEGMGGGNLNCR